MYLIEEEPQVFDSGLLLPLAGPPPLPPERPVTSAGIPYPTSQDSVCHIDQFIQEQAAAIEYRIANSALQVGMQTLTTNGNGDFNITFPRFSVVQGVVLQQYAWVGAGNTDIFVLTPILVGLYGNICGVHVWQIPTRSAGSIIQPFANTAYNYFVFAWGVPV